MKGVVPQRYISECSEHALNVHGDNYLGAGYTKSPEEAENRYAVMLDVIRDPTVSTSVLDFGCGLAHMLDYIERKERFRNIKYTGLDISAKYLAAARQRHPQANLIELDVLKSDADLPQFDYVILNGLFNYRGELDRRRMMIYWKRLLNVMWPHARIGLAFNVMTKLVDWERDELFHLPLGTMTDYVGHKLSRHFVVRHDYRAYEYTTYVYREPSGA